MGIRISSILNDLNITLETASDLLKKGGLKGPNDQITLNTRVSEEQQSYLISHCNKMSSSKKNNANKVKTNNKKKASTRKTQNELKKDKESLVKAFLQGRTKQVMELSIPFNLCLSVFNLLYKNDGNIIGLRSCFYHTYGYRHYFSYSDLFRRKVSMNKSTYFYYGSNGAKEMIHYRCLASLILCLLSYAVKTNQLSKEEYKVLINNQLKDYMKLPQKIVLTKRDLKKGKQKRQWFSVVSVPFGGMNKRY